MKIAAAVSAACMTLTLAGCSGADAPPRPVSLPAFDDPAGVKCVSNYPEELEGFDIAFSGTIVQEKAGRLKENEEKDKERAVKPADFVFEVDEVFLGDVDKKFTLHSYDYLASTPNQSHVGERFLVATSPTHDLVLCGYTRPYSEQDAEFWRYTFGTEATS